MPGRHEGRSWTRPDAYLSPAIGPAGQKERLAPFRAAFPDTVATAGRLGEMPTIAVLRWAARGTHWGACLGRPVAWKGTAISCLAVGKIEDEWGNVELAGLLRQLHATTDDVLLPREGVGATPIDREGDQ